MSSAGDILHLRNFVSEYRKLPVTMEIIGLLKIKYEMYIFQSCVTSFFADLLCLAFDKILMAYLINSTYFK